MTSTYVTESFYQNVTSTSSKPKEMEPTSENNSFYQSMNEATAKQDLNDDYNPIKEKKKDYLEQSNDKTSEANRPTEADKPSETNEKLESDKPTEATKTSAKTDTETVNKELEQCSKDIQKKIEEMLGLTAEELNKAMEALGLNPMDLLNPEKLTQLMIELSGENDMLSLLTNEVMYGNVSELVKMLETTLGDIQEEFSLTPQELKEMMNQLEQPLQTETELEIDQTKNAQNTDGGKELLEEVTVESPDTSSKSDSKDQQSQTGDSTNPKEEQVDLQKPEDSKEHLVSGKEPSGSGKSQQENSLVQVTNTKETVEDSPKNLELQLGNKKEQQGNLQEKSDSGQPNQELPNEKVVTMDSNTNMFQSVGDQIQAKLDAILQDTSKLAEQPNTEQIMKQVLNHMKLNVSGQVTEMELQLHPASLGTINLQVAFKNGALTAQLTAQSEAVKVALESQMTQLKESLNEQGLKVEAIEVTVETHEFEQNLQHNQGNEDGNHAKKQGRRKIVLDDLEDMEGQLDDEEQMIAQIMADNGNSVDFSA